MAHEPVTHTKTAHRLGRRPAGTTIEAAVHRYEGGAGPTVYVGAAQHGIELNGPVVARRLHERLTGAELAGIVVVVPVANPLAFDHRSYRTPAAYDARNGNLNRAWPGDDEGSLGERVAARLWELVSEADAVVDLHTGSREMLEHVRFREGSEARALAAAFGTEYLLADPDETDGGESGKLRAAAERAGVPALTAELSNSRTVNYGAVEAGVDGVCNVLRQLDLLAGSPPEPPGRTVLRGDLEGVTAAEAGLFEPRREVGVGDRIEAGDELGAVYCPTSFERRSTVAAGADGVLYSFAAGRTVLEGERLAALATPL
jgi:predicted deacylase